MPEASLPQGPRRPRWRLLVVAVGVVGSVAFGALGPLAITPGDTFFQLDYVATTAAALSLVLTGALLITRLPSHPVGWLLWAGGCLFAISSGGAGAAQVLAPAAPAIADWCQLASASVWVPAIVAVTVLLPLVYPTGRLPSPRWRIVVAVGTVAAAFSIAQSALTPFNPSGLPAGISNPIAAAGVTADLANLMGDLSNLAGVICLPLVAASLILRFRQASGVERAQLKWLALAVAIAGPALAVALVMSVVPGDLAAFLSNVAFLVMFIGLALLPVAIGIAVLRYRLYEIDLIIRRTVVYIPLTAILAGVYAGSTALLQKLFIAATGQRSDGAIIASTLILATLFTPIRSWLQGIVDRRFRDQLDAERQLDAYITRIATAEWSPDPARTMRAFVALASAALGATGGRAVVEAGVATPGMATPDREESLTIVAVVEADGQRLGRIELGPKAHGRSYRASEIELVTTAAHRLAGAILGLDGAASLHSRTEANPVTAPRPVPGVELQAEPGEP